MAAAHVRSEPAGAMLRLVLSADDVQRLDREFAVVLRSDEPGFPAELAEFIEIRVMVEVE